jgi:hypothetical protein
MDPDTPYIALEHMPKRCIALSDWDLAIGVESNKFEFRKGEILFGKLRPYFHKVGVAPVDGVCSTDIVVVAPRTPQWFAFVLGLVSSDEFVEYTNAGSTGTKMPRTSWTEMARYDIALPAEPLARALTERLRPPLTASSRAFMNHAPSPSCGTHYFKAHLRRAAGWEQVLKYTGAVIVLGAGASRVRVSGRKAPPLDTDFLDAASRMYARLRSRGKIERALRSGTILGDTF